MADGRSAVRTSLQAVAPEPDRLSLDFEIRPVRPEDLEPLEWFGLHTQHREIIRQAYTMQECKAGLMLVAEVNGFPAGQICVDYVRRRPVGRATLWALRVFPPLRGIGLGTRLMAAAEQAAGARGVRETELGVDRDNARVLPFYARLGYRGCGTERGSFSYRTPDGTLVHLPIDQWILRKTLPPIAPGRAAERLRGTVGPILPPSQ